MTHIPVLNLQPVEKLSDAPLLDVHSTFFTIQGEGPHTGRPAMFVRLAGCNLQCPGCDTDYTSRRKHFDTLADRVISFFAALGEDDKRTQMPLVVVTGGEPFRQPIALVEFCNRVDRAGIGVQIETNGTLPIPQMLHRRVDIVVSPKTGSVHTSVAERALAWKYVLRADDLADDGLPVHTLDHNVPQKVARPPKGFPVSQIYIQPLDQRNERANKENLNAAVSACMKYGYRLQLQVHKLIGVE